MITDDLPPFWRRVLSLARATVRFAVGGFRETPDHWYRERRQLCDRCEKHDRARDRCRVSGRKLGESLLGQLKMPAERCPIGKWGPCPRVKGEV